MPLPGGILQARGVARGHVLKHMAIAKKINSYLGSTPSANNHHCTAVQDWLSKLETQVGMLVGKWVNGWGAACTSCFC